MAGRLRAFLLNKRTKAFIGPVEPEQARGFDADIVVFEREPRFPTDATDFIIFKECTANSHEARPIIASPMV